MKITGFFINKTLVSVCAVLCVTSFLGANMFGFGKSKKDGDKKSDQPFYTISAEKAKERMQSAPAPIIVDVRTKGEYEQAHIPSAILIPNETIGTQRPEQLPDLDAEIIVYCRSGARSRQAVKKLAAMGYTRVYDLGGIMSWPYETTKD
ncbi:rhodanese-like domain-containing protein [Treponema lecithinolyticum]|uniref:Rhodanese-like protein n=1 Tax=Treponema lecithinolyticum ATCC 700332 TaxID=1321815 RepID=A0ABN0P3N6_TRELE|nr:rhodanese-like domain-containing protein [Treponema lecithinolyticum]ERJ94583.1 rhodanese-like protein [Treponema lecithinolyticum ATCC 700332]